MTGEPRLDTQIDLRTAPGVLCLGGGFVAVGGCVAAAEQLINASPFLGWPAAVVLLLVGAVMAALGWSWHKRRFFRLAAEQGVPAEEARRRWASLANDGARAR